MIKNPQILFVVSTKKDGCVIEQNLIKGILLHFQRTLVMQWILSIRIPPVLQAPHTAWLFFSVYEFVFLCEQWAL